MFRAGLATVLDAEPDLLVVPTADGPVDVVIVELVSNRVPLDRALHHLPVQCKILAISVFKEPALVASLLRIRVAGYALKSQSDTEIVGAVRTVLGGARYIPPDISSAAVDRLVAHAPQRSLDSLTRREREVFELLMRGHSNHELATRLYLSPRTVEAHRQHIMRKLGAHSVLEMIHATSWQLAPGEGT